MAALPIQVCSLGNVAVVSGGTLVAVGGVGKILQPGDANRQAACW